MPEPSGIGRLQFLDSLKPPVHQVTLTYVEKYVEMNVAHPFREGNRRSGRIWLDHMLRAELGRTVDWSAIPREDYLLAMERNPVRDTEIKALLSDALNHQLDDVALLARGIDASYAYEGYAAYRAAEL